MYPFHCKFYKAKWWFFFIKILGFAASIGKPLAHGNLVIYLEDKRCGSTITVVIQKWIIWSFFLHWITLFHMIYLYLFFIFELWWTQDQKLKRSQYYYTSPKQNAPSQTNGHKWGPKQNVPSQTNGHIGDPKKKLKLSSNH